MHTRLVLHPISIHDTNSIMYQLEPEMNQQNYFYSFFCHKMNE